MAAGQRASAAASAESASATSGLEGAGMEELLGALLAGAAERPSDQAPPPAQISLPLFLFSRLCLSPFLTLRLVLC